MNILESADVQDRRERDSSVEIPDSEHVVTGGNEQHLWWERAASLVCSISWTSWLGVSGLFIQHIRLTYDKPTELNDVVFCEFILDLFPEQFNLLLTEVKWIDFSTQNHFLIICGKLVQVSDRMKSGATQGAEKKYSWGDAGKVLMFKSRHRMRASLKPLSDCLVFDITKSVETYRPHKDRTGLI